MSNKPDRKATLTGRAGVIRAVQTPLGFFALVVLAVEAIIGILATSLNPSQKTFLVNGMMILLFIAVLAVALIAYFRPHVLENIGSQPKRIGAPRYSLVLTAPDRLPNLDVTLIDWDNENCFLVDGTRKIPVTPVPSRIGPSFQINVPPRLLDQLPEGESFELALRDQKGNRWRVKRFYFFETVLPLSLGEEVQKIMEDYGEEQDG
jgi:hypothetical protein